MLIICMIYCPNLHVRSIDEQHFRIFLLLQKKEITRYPKNSVADVLYNATANLLSRDYLFILAGTDSAPLLFKTQ